MLKIFMILVERVCNAVQGQPEYTMAWVLAIRTFPMVMVSFHTTTVHSHLVPSHDPVVIGDLDMAV